MANSVSFRGGQVTIQNLSGSGIGFYGAAGFGKAVTTAAWQDHSYITDSTGTNLGPELWNLKYQNAQSGIIGQAGSGVALTCVPNYQALNVHWEFDSPVQLTNVQLFIYDRVSTNNPPSGVTCAVAEIIHPDTTQGNSGSGSTSWQFPAGSSYMTLANSPGVSGLYAGNGTSSTRPDTIHDHFVGISCSPNSIGGKFLAALVQGEFL